MKTTTVAATSIAAFHDHKANGFAGQHGIILAVMRPGKLYSRRQISQMTKLETSTVSARVNEMLETGLLEVCGTLKCPHSGRHVEAVKRVAVQMELM